MGLSQKEGPQSPLPLTPVLGRQKTWLSPSALFFLAITKFLPMGGCCSRVRVGKGEEREGRVPEEERYGAYSQPGPWDDALCVARLAEELCT